MIYYIELPNSCTSMGFATIAISATYVSISRVRQVMPQKTNEAALDE